MSAASLHLPALPSYPFNGEQQSEYLRPLGGYHISPTSRSVFRKESKTGNIALELVAQRGDGTSPIYGVRDVIRGKVAIHKTDVLSSVTVKLDGHLRIQEIGGAGRQIDKVLDEELNLWTNQVGSACPHELEFSFALPPSFSKEGKEYTLPPTIDVHLSGVPGFRADVAYTVAVHVHKSKNSVFGNITSLSFPVIYFPRMRPLHPIPPPPPQSAFSSAAVHVGPEWEPIEATMESRSQFTNPINIKLFIPTGRTYSKQTPIPFRLHITSNAFSLASFLPCSPTNAVDRNRQKTGSTRVYIIRHVSVDARNAHSENVKTDIFRSILAGEGVFRRLGDGQEWATWEGEIHPDLSVLKIGSFKAPGLWVRDILVLSIVPPNPIGSPLKDLRKVIPIRFVTEPHASQAEVDQVSDLWDGDVKMELPEI